MEGDVGRYDNGCLFGGYGMYWGGMVEICKFNRVWSG